MYHLLMIYLSRWGYCPFRKIERKSYTDSHCNASDIRERGFIIIADKNHAFYILISKSSDLFYLEFSVTKQRHSDVIINKAEPD